MMLSQDVGSERMPGSHVAEAWDPYDVWLQRIKRPRDRQPLRGVVLQTTAVAHPAPALHGTDTEDAWLLPHAP